MHRRTDDPAGQIAVGDHGPDRAERVAEAGHDSLRRIGQGAVQIEDHQLRACLHESILPDVSGRAVAGPTAHYCRDVASQLRREARYHGDEAVVPGMLDFAVNVRAAGPPSWLVDRLAAGIDRSRPLPDRDGLASRGGSRRRQARAQLRRGRAAGRSRRGVRAAAEPASAVGCAHRAVVHRARSGAGRRRRAHPARRAWRAVRPGRRGRCRTRPISS